MIIDFNKLENIYKLKSIIRYNTRMHIKNESVAEHSFYVALLTLMICDKENMSDEIKLQAIIKALLHDMPEIETNDITHDAKERLNLRTYLKKYENAYFIKEFPKYAKMMISDSKSIVSSIVDLADTLSVIQYVNNEISLGNTSNDIKDILQNAKHRIEKYEKEIKETK